MENFKISKWPFFSEDEIDKAKSVLKSGLVNYWTGNETKLFENEFAQYCNSSNAIALANGSLALSAAYLSLNLKRGDEIITTPRTFIASASSAVLLGLKPIFADVDINSGLITPETIEPLITNRTKAICVVHLGGWPADMPRICDLAKTYKLKIIEDCSQAHGASIYLEGDKTFKSVGSFGKKDDVITDLNMPKPHGWWATRNSDRIAFQMIITMQAGNSIGTRNNLAVIIGKTDHGKFARLKPKA